MLTDVERNILIRSVKEGGITQEDVLDVLSHQSTVSSKLRDLCEEGFLVKKDAPRTIPQDYVYVPTNATVELFGDYSE